jgi:hypothetical protein
MTSFHAPIFRKLYESVVNDVISTVSVLSLNRGGYRIKVQRIKSIHVIDRTYEEVIAMHQAVQRIVLSPVLLSVPPVPSRKRSFSGEMPIDTQLLMNAYFVGLVKGVLGANQAENQTEVRRFFSPRSEAEIEVRRFFAPRSEAEIRNIQAVKDIEMNRTAGHCGVNAHFPGTLQPHLPGISEVFDY